MTQAVSVPDREAAAAHDRHRSAKKQRGTRHSVLTVVLGLLALLWLVPAFGLLVTSFRETSDATSTGWWTALAHLFTNNWTLSNYANALSGNTAGTGMPLSAEFLNSVAVVVPATVLPLMFSAFAAYGFTFLEFKGKEVLFGIVVGLLVVPVQIALIPVLQTYQAITKATGIPIVGTFPAAWIVHSAFALPLCIFILRNYMSTLPVALIEAARVDGASHFQIFWRLVIPMSTPALASFAIFQFLWVWNDFLVAYIFLNNTNPVLQQGLLGLLGQYSQGWNLVAAGSFIVLIVPLIVFLSLQRYFVRGLTSGAVK